MLDSQYCHAHRKYTPEIHKDRWVRKYLVGQNGPVFLFTETKPKLHFLKDLESGSIHLTKEDLQKIPIREYNVDIYVLLLERGFANYGDHPRLEWTGLWFFTSILRHFANDEVLQKLKTRLEKSLILSSGQSLYTFLHFMGGTAKGRPSLANILLDYIPTLLDTDAAKELSWMSYNELDKLRITYEKELGAQHFLTRCLVLRWLLDIKELYQTEKTIQKIKMDQCKEEIMMNRWHPDRVEKYLLAGLDIDDM